MVFRNKNQSSKQLIEISINGQPIEEVNFAKYLGILIDHKLTFKMHTNQISKKLIRGNILIARLRHFVSRKILLNFYFVQNQDTLPLNRCEDQVHNLFKIASLNILL